MHRSAAPSGDGLPDTWEVFHGTEANVFDADSDPDGDGLTNLDEYRAGTHPLESLSVLRVEQIVAGPAAVTIEFLATANRGYSLLYKDNLSGAAWSKVANVSAQPTNRTASATHLTPAEASGFYRVVTPQTP